MTFTKTLFIFTLVIILASSSPPRILQNCTATPAQNQSVNTTNNLNTTLYNITLQDIPPPVVASSFTPYLADLVPYTNNLSLNVPENFTVNIFADNLTNPRWLALTPDGNVLVALTNQSTILLLKDTDGDGVADQTSFFLNSSNGLNETFGMAFSNDSFFVGNPNQVLKYPYTSGQDNITEAPQVIATLPVQNEGTRTVVLSPDGTKLYVTVGASTEITNDEPELATVLQMDLDGSNLEIFASGLRDPKGLAFNPASGELYIGVAERDALGDETPPDYFTRIQEGEFFGWPYTYISPNNLDPRLIDNQTNASVDPTLAASTIVPDVLIEGHTTPMGISFYTGNTFPANYTNGAFLALHGSSGLKEARGYKVVWIPFGDDNRPTGGYYDFVTGFLLNASTVEVWGRPTGTLIASDGSLLFTDDDGGRIFRVQYQNTTCSS